MAFKDPIKAWSVRARNNDSLEDSVVLSVVVPMHNEQATLPIFFSTLFDTLDPLNLAYEVVCVDDGSTDGTVEQVLEQRKQRPNIALLSLSRNFGKESALTAGLSVAKGQAIVPIDADLQDPPALIGPMLALWRAGAQVVHAQRQTRYEDGFLKRFTAGIFYRAFNQIGRPRLAYNVGDFRLMDRCVVKAFLSLPERVRFNKGLFSWVGFSAASVVYDRPARRQGTSAWTFWRLWNFALDGITGFSTLPLRLWTYLGLLISLAAFAYGGIIVGRTVLFGNHVPGYASLLCSILLIGGIQLISLGMIGEYIGRIFEETKQRPLFIVQHHYHSFAHRLSR